MGLLDAFSNWVEAPHTEFYQCSNCGSRFEEPDSSCPECGGEIETDQPSEISVYYWGPM